MNEIEKSYRKQLLFNQRTGKFEVANTRVNEDGQIISIKFISELAPHTNTQVISKILVDTAKNQINNVKKSSKGNFEQETDFDREVRELKNII